jgi:hypothetical protein
VLSTLKWRLAVVLLLSLISGEAFAETRLYRLRVTLRNGERYETISAFDPVNYCHVNGGSTIRLRDRSLIFSPQMKVRILRTWIDPHRDLAGRWLEILEANNMPVEGNRKVLPRIEPLTFEDMMSPD